MRQKMAIFKEGNSVCRVQFLQAPAKIATHLRIRLLTFKRRISQRGYTLSLDPVLDLSDQKQGPKDY